MCSISMLREPEEVPEFVFFPCKEDRVCPYGSLIEMMPLASEVEGTVEERLVCELFGHCCPYHYYAELI